MYGTVARVRLLPGREQEFLKEFESFRELNVPGYIGEYVYRMDDDPNEFYMAVLFESKAAYHANAQDPAQDERYQTMRALLAEEPEWHDGEVVVGRR